MCVNLPLKNLSSGLCPPHPTSTYTYEITTAYPRHILNHISYSHVFKFFNNNHYNDSPRKDVIITIIEWIILKLIIFDFVTKKKIKSTIIQFFVSYVKDGKVCKTTPNPYFFLCHWQHDFEKCLVLKFTFSAHHGTWWYLNMEGSSLHLQLSIALYLTYCVNIKHITQTRNRERE